MPNLNDQQQAFVTAFTSDPGAIGNASEAARRAGYSEKSARDIGRQLLAKPHVRAAVEEANRAQLGGALASKAVAVLASIIDDETAAPKLRLDAAKTVLDRAGYIAPKAAESPKPESEADALDGMNLAQLKRFVAAHEAGEGDGCATQH